MTSLLPPVPYPLLRRALFTLPPAKAQKVGDGFLKWASQRPWALSNLEAHHAVLDERLHVEALGRRFPNPLGAAGGVDKNGTIFPALQALGFGHVEVGTVTPRQQDPNPGQILWRAPKDKGLVNAMGFPNDGMDAVAPRVHAAPRPGDGQVGINVGPNRDKVDAVDEELAVLLPHLAPLADFLTLNLSSPNTKGLRGLQDPKTITATVGKALTLLDGLPSKPPRLMVKLSPDSDDEATVAQAKAAIDAGAAGVVATNTTVTRPEHLAHLEKGGLSGAPLRARATEVVRLVAKAVGDDGIVVGVGGISSGADAAEKLAAGASLVQAYTGFIYRGPGFPGLVCKELLTELDARGLDRVSELSA
ncbi:MAG: quinone-dependent dihydroorotate dehydrogenase [Thermoplasmatota archaeon]